MSNFLHLKIGLAQDNGISSLLLGYRSHLGHRSISDLLNLAKFGSRNGSPPEGNWTPSRLCTIADYSWVIIKDTLWHLAWFHWKCTIYSLECRLDKMAAILQTTFSNAFPEIKMFTFLSIIHRTLFPWVQYVTKKEEIVKKICCRQILEVVERSGYLYKLSSVSHFSLLFWLSFKRFSIKSEGCWYALWRRSQCMIFKFNALSTHISAKQLHLQGSVKHSPKSSYIISPKRQHPSSW